MCNIRWVALRVTPKLKRSIGGSMVPDGETYIELARFTAADRTAAREYAARAFRAPVVPSYVEVVSVLAWEAAQREAAAIAKRPPAKWVGKLLRDGGRPLRKPQPATPLEDDENVYEATADALAFDLVGAYDAEDEG